MGWGKMERVEQLGHCKLDARHVAMRNCTSRNEFGQLAATDHSAETLITDFTA